MVGGHVTVTPSAEITAFLRSRGITVTPLGAMKVGTGSLTMPMVGGHDAGSQHAGHDDDQRRPASTPTGPSGSVIRNYRLTDTAHGARLTAVVNGRRILIATMSAPTVGLSGKTGTMSGGLKLSAAWAHLINHLVGMHVVHPGEDLGDLKAKVKMA